MAVVSEASKEIQMDRINNKINFLSGEIKRTQNQMNSIYTELDKQYESSKEYNGISMGNLKLKKREYDDKRNHLISCITSLETQISKIPVAEEDYDNSFVEDFLQRVAMIEQQENNMEQKTVDTFSIDNSGRQYVKTKTGIIVPAGKEVKPLPVSMAAKGYICRATTFVSLLNRVISEYRTVYFYGGNGQPATKALWNQLSKVKGVGWWYTGKHLATTKHSFSNNYWAFDCSGFLRAVMWGWCGDSSKTYGGSCFGKNTIVPYHLSGDMIKASPKGKSPYKYVDQATRAVTYCGDTDFSTIVPGECLYMVGHVGAYAGNGMAAECTPSFKNGCQNTYVSNVKSVSASNKRSWAAHGKLPYIDYSNTMSDNLGNGWIAGPGNGGMDTGMGGGLLAQIGYINGVNASDLYESDNYYGYGEKTEFIERTVDSSIVRIVVPKSTTVASLAKSLSMTASNLLALNPSLKKSGSSTSTYASSSTVLNSGMKVYVPASAYTAAKEAATSSYNNAASQIEEIDKLLSKFQDDSETLVSSSYTTSASKSASTSISTLLTTKAKAVVVDDEASILTTTKSGSSSSAKATNYATASSSGQTNSEKMRDYKGWTRVYDTGPYEGYADARIIITKNGSTRVLKTVISPTGFSDVFSNNVNLQQTAGGWFIARHGENPVNLSISGLMLDTDANAEKHNFIKEWKNYLTDKKSTRTGLFYNNSTVKIQLEGIRYEGILDSINFTKDAARLNVYNFNMNFTCVDYKVTRSVSGAIGRLGKKKTSTTKSGSKAKISTQSSPSTQVMATSLYRTMTK